MIDLKGEVSASVAIHYGRMLLDALRKTVGDDKFRAIHPMIHKDLEKAATEAGVAAGEKMLADHE